MKVSINQMTCLVVILVLLFSIGVPFPTTTAFDPRYDVVIDQFGDGDYEKNLTFLPGGGINQEAYFSIPQNQTVLNSSFEVEGLPNGLDVHPENITINVGQDNDYEWGFIGDGYGPLGKQKRFLTNETNTTVYFGGPKTFDNSKVIRLPKYAKVEYADLKIGGVDPAAFPQEKALTYGSLNSGVPFNNQLWTSARFQVLYLQSELNMGGTIDKIYFQASDFFQNIKFDNFRIRLSETNKTSLGSNFTRNYGPVVHTVMNSPFFKITTLGAGSWIEFDINNTLFYNNTNNLLVEILWKDQSSNTGLVPVEVGIGTGNYRRVFTGNDEAYTGAADPMLYNFKVKFESGWAYDVSVDVGDDGDYQYFSLGKFNDNLFMNKEGLAYELSTFLESYFYPPTYIDSWGNKFIDIPLNVSCSSTGRVYISNMSIKYYWIPVVDKNGHNGNLSTELTEHIPQSGEPTTNIKINIDVEAESAGILWLKNIYIMYRRSDGPPEVLPIPDFHVHEDKIERIDLSPYFDDDNTDPKEMTYEILDFTDTHVNVSIVNNYELQVDASITPNWHGNFTLRLRVSDHLGAPVESGVITVFVDPVNDEPTPNIEIPDFSLNEDTTSANIFFNASEYFTDIDNDPLFYSIEIDPYNKVPDEDIKITIKNHGSSFTVTGRNNWYGENIPIWIYCDDDNFVNTRLNITDGYVHQEVNVTVNPVNDAPYWLNSDGVPNINVNEDENHENMLFMESLVDDIDNEVSELNYSILSQEKYKDQVRVEIDSNHYLDVYTLEKNWYGTDTVTVAVSDGNSYIVDNFDLTVNSIDDQPVVKISSHYNGQILEGIINIVGTVTDIEDHRIEGVEIMIENETFSSTWEHAIHTVGAEVWSYEWDTTQYGDDWYDFSVKAYQYTGGTSDKFLYSEILTFSFYLNNWGEPPEVSTKDILVNITEPGNGATVKETVTISGTVTILSNGNISAEQPENVQIRFIGPKGPTPWYNTEGLSVWTFTWNTQENHFDNGDYTIQVMAIKSGNYTIVKLNVKLDNPTEPDKNDDDTTIIKYMPGDDSAQRLYYFILLVIIVIIILVIILVAVLRKRHRDEEEQEEEEDERVELKDEDKKEQEPELKKPKPEPKPTVAPKSSVAVVSPAKPGPTATPTIKMPTVIAKPVGSGGASSLSSEYPLIQEYSPTPEQLEILPVAKSEVKPSFKVHFCTNCKKPFKIKLPIVPKKKIKCPWCETRNFPGGTGPESKEPAPPTTPTVVAKPASPQPTVTKPEIEK